MSHHHTTNGIDLVFGCNKSSPDNHTIEDLEGLNNSLDTTSSGFDPECDYQQILPDKINVFRKLNIDLLDNVDSKIKQSVITFLQSFVEVIVNNRSSLETVGNLPSLIISQLEDASLLIEWGFKDFKIGFSFEPNEEESSWYVVTNDKFQDVNASGRLFYNSCKELLLSILRFVASNT